MSQVVNHPSRNDLGEEKRVLEVFARIVTNPDDEIKQIIPYSHGLVQCASILSSNLPFDDNLRLLVSDLVFRTLTLGFAMGYEVGHHDGE